MAASVWFVLFAAPASAQSERINSYDVTIVVQPNGDLAVDERIAYDFGDSTDHHGIFRTIPVVYRYNAKQNRIYRLQVESVSVSGGASAKYDVSKQGADVVIKIGDKDRTVTGAHTYDIAYRVEGVLNAFPNHDELYWNAIGSEWSVPISQARVHVTIPGSVQEFTCFAGPEGSSLPCDSAERSSSQTVQFAQELLQPFGALTVVVGMPKGAVTPEPVPILVDRQTAARAFTLNPLTVGVSSLLLVGLLALFGVSAWRTGRDRRYVGSAVDVAFGPGDPKAAEQPDQVQAVPLFERSDFPVEFEPPEGLRPGEVGTLVDEVAGPLDVSATIVDLAVRGYLMIEEIPKHGLFGKPDWRLTQTKEPDAALKAYESKLLTALFSHGAEPDEHGRLSVLMSGLRTKFAKDLITVENALYDDALQQGWFRARPDKIRNSWRARAWLVLIIGIVLEFFAVKSTKYGLLPVPLIILGIVMLVGAKRMPSRTAKGTGLLRRTLGFRTFISEGTEAAMAKFAEKENLFSDYLPYAIVFGVTEKWAKVFERLSGGAPPPQTGWYISPHPFSYAAFSSSMDHFTTSTTGAIASTPAGSGHSGFSGGFSGGGGGGGGGGSW